MKRNLLIAAVLLIMVTVAYGQTSKQAEGKRPNIVIILGDDDHAPCPGHEKARVRALVCVLLHPRHRGVAAVPEPLAQMRPLRLEGARRGDADLHEAHVEGRLPDLLRERHRPSRRCRPRARPRRVFSNARSRSPRSPISGRTSSRASGR